jgi:8-oxo-dGTP pyrophosphatase MutT (NUDIX family)
MAGEDLKDTAVREVCEELGLRADDLFVERQLDDYTYDETVERLGTSKVTYLYVMRYLPGRRPVMSADVDHRQACWWPIAGRLPFMHYAYQRTLLAETLERMFQVRAAFE